jgi:hypothetical protein
MSVGIAESIVLGKNLSDTFRQLAQQILVNIVAKTIERIILMGIEKVLSIFLTDQEAKKENLIRKQNSALKQQIALQAILTALVVAVVVSLAFAEGGRVNGTRAEWWTNI